MSQIMEALKQAQAQRSAAATAGDVPAAPPEAQPIRRAGRAWRWVLAAALVGGLACWAWFELAPGLTVTAQYPSSSTQHAA